MDCHNDLWLAAQEKSYIHQPVANKECTVCHLGSTSTSAQQPQEQLITTVIAEFNRQQHINWLAESFTPAVQHFALLEQKKADTTITVEAWSPERDKVSFDLKIPPWSTLETVQPFPSLNIKNLHLVGNHDMLLSQATIGWETTSPSRCRVTYTAAGNDYVLNEDDLFTLHHSIVLHNCSKQDSIQLSCADPFSQQLSTATAEV